jgi:phosphatidylglycerophosphate synthase
VRRPPDPLFISALRTAITGLVVLMCLALAARAVLPLGLWYPVKAGGLFAVTMVIAIGGLREHHPFPRFGPANQLTVARAVFVMLVVSVIGEAMSPAVATSAALAGLGVTLLDGADGWLARRSAMASPFGARFDVEIDALLIQGLSILVWRSGKAGPWVLLSGLLRYGFVGAGWLWPWVRGPLAPTRRARVICVVQIGSLLLVIVPAVLPPASAAIAAVGLASLSYSFLMDTLRLWHARQPADVNGSESI